MALSNWRIRTPQLLIRDFTVADNSAAYIAGLNDKAHMRFSAQGLVDHTLESQRAYIESFDGTPNYLLALELQDEEHPVIGSITAYFDADDVSADIGIFLVPGNAGRGLGKEAWCAVAARFEAEGVLEAVTAGTARSNESMQALMSAGSFRLVQVDHDALVTPIGVEDAFRYRREFRGQ